MCTREHYEDNMQSFLHGTVSCLELWKTTRYQYQEINTQKFYIVVRGNSTFFFLLKKVFYSETFRKIQSKSAINIIQTETHIYRAFYILYNYFVQARLFKSQRQLPDVFQSKGSFRLSMSNSLQERLEVGDASLQKVSLQKWHCNLLLSWGSERTIAALLWKITILRKKKTIRQTILSFWNRYMLRGIVSIRWLVSC